MFIEKIEQDTIKINFYTREEEIRIGDLLKVVSLGRKGVLAQVIKVETSENNQNYNTATSKILFTIEDSGKLDDWQGNVPGNDFVVCKATSEEVLSVTKTGDVSNPVLSGQLSGYPEVPVNIEAAFMENSSLIAGDREAQKNELLELFAINLSEKGAKVVLIDYNGDFSDDEEALVLKAGKDVKLPFDKKGIETLYNKALSGASSEIRAGIENIFSEIEDYLTDQKITFLPFKVFVDAVKTESKSGNLPELDLLSNSLSKLLKKGVFSNNQKEIVYLFNSIKENNLVILDLSDIDREWKPVFTDFIFRFNREKFHRNFFLLMDIDKYAEFNAAEPAEITEKIFNCGVKSGIKPIVTAGHDTELVGKIFSEAENVFMFRPHGESKITGLRSYLPRIGASDVLVSGKITNNVPLYIKLPVLNEQEEVFFKTPDIDSRLETEISQYNEPVQVFKPEMQHTPLEKQIEEEQDVPNDRISEIEDIEPYVPASGHEEKEPETPETEDYTEPYEEYTPQEAVEITEEEIPSEETVSYEENADNPLKEYSQLESDEAKEEYSYQEYAEEKESVIEEKTAYQRAMEELESDFEEKSQEEDDEESYYTSSEEFQDESVLDYINSAVQEYSKEDYQPETNEERSEFSNNDLNNFMDYEEESEDTEDDEVSYYTSSEEFQDESMLDYVNSPQATEAEEEYEPEYSGESREISNEDLNNFMDYDEIENTEIEEDSATPAQETYQKQESMPAPRTPNLPVYDVPGNENGVDSNFDLKEGDTVRHKKYGVGVIKKVIGYSEKKLCSIQFENVGRRLLDPKIAELEKIQ